MASGDRFIPHHRCVPILCVAAQLIGQKVGPEALWDLPSVGAGTSTDFGAAARFFTADPTALPSAQMWGWIVAAGVTVTALAQGGKFARRWQTDSADEERP
jgi:hypothetical protein